MNTREIYTAQLNVSRYYTCESITRLVNMIAQLNIGKTYYNTKTNTIDINCNRLASLQDDSSIRQVIRSWINTFPIECDNKDILNSNIDLLFNITKLGYPNLDNHIINIYLY